MSKLFDSLALWQVERVRAPNQFERFEPFERFEQFELLMSLQQ
jgi:hypothetical protein